MIEIIPAIDIIGGKCVRLTKGDYDQKKVYNENPLEVALMFQECGCKHLHLVDLDGAKSKHIVNYNVLEKIATKTNLHIDFGGGLKSDDDLRIAFECGAQQITGGSIAVTNPTIFIDWLEKYGANRIILGADSKNEKISINGWQATSDSNLYDFISYYAEKGITNVISTDIDCDGTLSGPSLGVYEKILNRIPHVRLIASGGVSSISDVLALNEINIPAVIVGKAIYENKISLKELEQFNK